MKSKGYIPIQHIHKYFMGMDVYICFPMGASGVGAVSFECSQKG